MLITVAQAAERLQVCKKTIYRRIADGSLPAIRISEKTLRIDENELKKFLDKLNTK